eukprot:g77330.t1
MSGVRYTHSTKAQFRTSVAEVVQRSKGFRTALILFFWVNDFLIGAGASLDVHLLLGLHLCGLVRARRDNKQGKAGLNEKAFGAVIVNKLRLLVVAVTVLGGPVCLAALLVLVAPLSPTTTGSSFTISVLIIQGVVSLVVYFSRHTRRDAPKGGTLDENVVFAAGMVPALKPVHKSVSVLPLPASKDALAHEQPEPPLLPAQPSSSSQRPADDNAELPAYLLSPRHVKYQQEQFESYFQALQDRFRVCCELHLFFPQAAQHFLHMQQSLAARADELARLGRGLEVAIGREQASSLAALLAGANSQQQQHMLNDNNNNSLGLLSKAEMNSNSNGTAPLAAHAEAGGETGLAEELQRLWQAHKLVSRYRDWTAQTQAGLADVQVSSAKRERLEKHWRRDLGSWQETRHKELNAVYKALGTQVRPDARRFIELLQSRTRVYDGAQGLAYLISTALKLEVAREDVENASVPPTPSVGPSTTSPSQPVFFASTHISSSGSTSASANLTSPSVFYPNGSPTKNPLNFPFEASSPSFNQEPASPAWAASSSTSPRNQQLGKLRSAANLVINTNLNTPGAGLTPRSNNNNTGLTPRNTTNNNNNTTGLTPRQHATSTGLTPRPNSAATPHALSSSKGATASRRRFVLRTIARPARDVSEQFEHILIRLMGHFTSILREEYVEENWEFCKDVQRLKACVDPLERKQQAMYIYANYISVNGDNTLNIPHWARLKEKEMINAVVSQVLPVPEDAFEEVMKEVVSLMTVGSFRRFLKSDTAAVIWQELCDAERRALELLADLSDFAHRTAKLLDKHCLKLVRYRLFQQAQTVWHSGLALFEPLPWCAGPAEAQIAAIQLRMADWEVATEEATMAEEDLTELEELLQTLRKQHKDQLQDLGLALNGDSSQGKGDSSQGKGDSSQGKGDSSQGKGGARDSSGSKADSSRGKGDSGGAKLAVVTEQGLKLGPPSNLARSHRSEGNDSNIEEVTGGSGRADSVIRQGKRIATKDLYAHELQLQQHKTKHALAKLQEAHQHVLDACTTYRAEWIVCSSRDYPDLHDLPIVQTDNAPDEAPTGTSAANWGAKAQQKELTRSRNVAMCINLLLHICYALPSASK